MCALIAGLMCLVVRVGPFVFETSQGQRGLLAVTVLAFLLVLMPHSPPVFAVATLAYLAFEGGVRHLLVPAFGYTRADPLVLVGAGIVVLFFLSSAATRSVPFDTRLSKLVAVLLGIMILQIANPIQGGPVVGIAAALFIIVPLLWFYIGQRYGSASVLRSVLSATIVIAVLGALYGLNQTWFGYNDAEKAWIVASGYDTPERVVSFFTSFPEYAHFLGIGCAMTWAAFLRGYRMALLPCLFLFAMVCLSSSRGLLLGTLSTCIALLAVQGPSVRSWIPRAALALVVGAMGLIWGLQEIQQTEFDPQANKLLHHQTQLLNPERSTLAAHLTMIAGGIVAGFENPLGRGLGGTTNASSRIGESGGQTTEVDVIDMLVSLGLIGGIVYIVLLVHVFRTVLKRWLERRDLSALQVFAILFFGFGHWLQGFEYAVTMLIWFSVGAMDHQAALTERRSHEIARLRPAGDSL